MNLTDPSTKQDLENFENRLFDRLADLIEAGKSEKPPQPDVNTDFVTRPEALQMLDITDNTLRKLVFDRKIPFTKLYGKIYYSKSALSVFIKPEKPITP